ncbi:hypothetical protein EAH79_07350 [Sphingomonas koreensis]|nr:hypothetical protein EAH79_07350 [Sphingomonas koreensis]
MLQLRPYVPLLKTGVAEIGAYRALFPDVKAQTFPIFNVRPWPRANHLQLTIDRVRDAASGHPFGFALDSDRFRHANAKPAQAEFDLLFEERRGFGRYYNLIEQIDDAVPVLIPTTSADTLLLQIGNAERLDRGLIIHQRRGSTIPLSDMILRLPPLPHDTVIVIDAGWSRNYLELEAWALPVMTRVHEALPDAELVIMSSSFPDSFSHIVGNAEEEGTERRLFSAARQRFQKADITYGDWGSTRPGQRGGGGGEIPSRVDVPTMTSWQIFRANPDNDLGFSEMAWDAQHHDCFGPSPDCWGKQTIAITNDRGAGVTSRQVAAQARINMHMTIQSEVSSVAPTDEIPYED